MPQSLEIDVRTPLLFLTTTVFTACSTIEGQWEGSMLCEDAGPWAAEFTIEKNEYGDTEFDGTVIDALDCRQDNDPETPDVPCDFKMFGTVEPANGSGTRNLDMRIDYCAADAGALGSTGYGCENPELAEWDGRRSIKIVHQTSGDIACKIDLDRQ